ncbi:Uncharacterized protein APZ42_022586 [Daphnia magna]|uniref:C-type lectin domain-containing protein n=1 Tax=Daphnia magna TaxID=35525 RepID=A0A164VLQ3_9CRUS|nr:Uncharacterized protein APZ42_022586 [Daphnia magna]
MSTSCETVTSRGYQEDRILVITALSGNLKEAQEFLTIHDGSGKDSPILIVENQKIHERSRKDLPKAVYTTQSTASIQFKKSPTSNLQLKIQKAVDCPFNLGTDSQCGRIVDEVSCYCATFTQIREFGSFVKKNENVVIFSKILRNQLSHRTFCDNNNMKLLTLETYEKEQAIQAAWAETEAYFWTSLTDIQQEGTWNWQSTGTSLYPGYANWCPGEPNDVGPNGGGEDCMLISNYSYECWKDYDCGYRFAAICQAIP